VTKLSVVVPTRAGARRLPVLLEALRRQTHPEWEAVVVVDGDVDGSADFVARAAGDLPVRTVVLPENRGRAAALNAGFAVATGAVLLRCDDDLEPAPEHLARHAAYHERADGPAGVVGLYRNRLASGVYRRVYGERADARLRTAAYAAAPGQAWRYWAGYASVTADTWRRIGPYDTRFRGYGWEDVDWGFRLHRSGVPIRLEPDLEVVHHAAASTTPDRALRAFYSGAARRRFEDIHATDPELPLLLPAPRCRGAWGVAVAAAARTATEDRVPRLGRAVESVAGRLPDRAAEKAVALVVEAAHLAGYRAGRTDGRI